MTDALTRPAPTKRPYSKLREHVPLAISILLATAIIALLIATLGNSSLWLDELMSLYYSDPAHARAGELWARMTSDLHPPGYYVLLYGWRELIGDTVVSARLLSTLLMTVVLAIYARRVWRELGAQITALSIAVVVVSHTFLVYAQEVRGYALIMLLTLSTAILYHNACLRNDPLPRSLAIIVGLCFLTETIHPYGVLWSGAVCIGLLVYRKTARDRAAIVVAGLILLIYPLARFAWMSQLAEENYNWFAYLDPLVELLFGLSRPLIIRADWWLTIIAALAAIYWLATRRIDWTKAGRAAPLAVLLPALVIPALVVHFAVEPSFNDRNLVIIAPAIWLLFPYLLASVWRSTLDKTVIVALIVLLCINHIARMGWLIDGFKSEWRASAAFVGEYAEACRGRSIPAFHYVDAERDTYFYRYYLTEDVDFDFVHRENLDEALSRGADGCPVKFWAAHGLSPDVIADRDTLDELGYEIVIFDHAAQWRDSTFAGAFVIYDPD